jgi:putative addiction module component (TIGR02574 family)
MSDRDLIVQRALSLTPEDRALLIIALEESLTLPTIQISDELLQELDRRFAEYEAGTAKSYSAAEVIESLRRRR